MVRDQGLKLGARTWQDGGDAVSPEYAKKGNDPTDHWSSDDLLLLQQEAPSAPDRISSCSHRSRGPQCRRWRHSLLQ